MRALRAWHSDPLTVQTRQPSGHPRPQGQIAKYPDGYLSEPELIRWEGWAVAIRGHDADGLDSPKAIIRGSYMEIRAFEIAYYRIRGRAKSSPLMVDSRVAMEA